jgi:hypothetical protein
VVRETDLLQKDCKCDYLEELLTAVFIAHTKVLSAIRLTTKQKKLQITIPKIDHFLHRVLSDSARSLWTNAYLFADTSSIEKQKNLRQVSSLLQESVLQGIRGLLPVKSILREYLYDNDKSDTLSIDDDDAEDKEVDSAVAEPVIAPAPAPSAEPVVPETVVPETVVAPAPAPSAEPVVPETVVPETVVPETVVPEPVQETVIAPAPSAEPVVPEPVQEPVRTPSPSPMIYIDTKPSVTFSQEHVMFDSDNLDNNEIQNVPFVEDENHEEEFDSLLIMDEILPMDSDEILE